MQNKADFEQKINFFLGDSVFPIFFNESHFVISVNFVQYSELKNEETFVSNNESIHPKNIPYPISEKKRIRNDQILVEYSTYFTVISGNL